MVMGSGLLALAMVAADGPSCPPVETTTYQVRVLTLDGLDWRTSSYSRLQPVAHQGTSTIWTADRALAASLADRAKGDSPCHTIMAVGEAALTKADAVNYIAAMDRVADGPMNHSSAIAFMPRPDQVEERFAIRVSGRKLDQGILTRIALEETHVDVIHGVPQSETLVPPAAKTSKNATELGREVLNVILAATPVVPQATSITSSVQIPEITRASVAGEWLIPNDGVLLVSLGVKTAADDKGMAVVRERVAVIEACSNKETGPKAASTMISAVQPAPFQHIKLGQPAVPGRSMPEAIDPNGNIVDLPPLPEALASADLDRIKPEPNQPSPQAPIQSAPTPSADPALARTSFDAVPAAPKVPTEAEEFVGEDIEIGLGDIVMALLKAGIKIDKFPGVNASNFLPANVAREKCAVEFDVEIKDGATAKPYCEQCDGDTTVCPATARSMKTNIVAGGMKLAPVGQPQLGITVKDARGVQVLDAVADLAEALKAPGRTDTSLIPLGENFSLEVKATVVPNSPDKARAAARKNDSTPSKR